MATNFPTSLDSLTNPLSTDTLNSPSHSDQHANVNDAVEALEAKVGVNGSAVTTSLDYKVGQLETNSVSKTVVDAQGELLIGTTNDTVGVVTRSTVNGDILVVDTSTTSGVRWQGQSNTGRNLVINGAMQVAQRGTSKTGITSTGFYTADRWSVSLSGFGTWTQSVEADAPSGSGFRNSLKFLCTTAQASPASGNAFEVIQRLEGQDVQRILKGTSSAQQLTVSFWVKSNVTGTYIFESIDADNSRSTSQSYTISASATWEKKTIVLPADTTGTLDNDNGNSLSVRFWLGAGSDYTSGTLATTWASLTNANRAVGQTNLAAATNNYWQITGVQLEVGPVATGFDFEPYERTLAKCQRYYYRWQASAAGNSFGNGFCDSATVALITFFLPTVMRASPTALETTGTAGDYSVRITAGTAITTSVVPSFTNASTFTTVVNLTVTTGLTGGHASQGRAVNANAYLAWSAEL